MHKKSQSDNSVDADFIDKFVDNEVTNYIFDPIIKK
jgi:hypothetical protein